MVKCELCDKELKSMQGLAKHIHTHNISSEEYYNKYLLKDEENACNTCGNDSKFLTLTLGYQKYCSCKCAHDNAIVKEAKKKTLMDNYGIDHPVKSKQIQEKIKRTNLERYGVENVSQSQIVKEKMKDTMNARYGVDFALQNKTIQEKMKDTMNVRYDVDYAQQSKTIRSKIDKGASNEKMKNTNIIRYGGPSPICDPKIKQQRYATMKLNNSFNTSKIEEEVYAYLVKTFGEDSIKRQYSSEEYPFACDFYIVDLDLYIEVNGSWTHGTEPFDNTVGHLALVDTWKQKNSKYYENAIYTWTVRDVNKRQVATKNNLNFLEIFSVNLEECKIAIENYVR